MTCVRSEEMSRLANHLEGLASVYAQHPGSVRAIHIRRAERSLVALEEFCTGPLPDEAQQWLKAKDAYVVLKNRLKSVDVLKAQIEIQQEDIDSLTKTLRLWNALQDAERQKFIQNHQRAKQYCEQNLRDAESHILHKYARYKAMNRLLPYADNAEHLCDAIFHFQNRSRYEENIVKIEQRRENALERLASVKRGFNLAVFMCVLIVSLPLCVPVAFSLWNRRREIEQQLANMQESQKREERRLQIADEGVVASEEIREILGDVPLETVRRTLEELRELRSEFQRVDKNPSVTAALVSFIDLYKSRLRELFGEVPEDTDKAFIWLRDEIDRVLNVEAERARRLTKLDEKKNELRRMLKGHGEAILRDSFSRVESIVLENFVVDVDEQTKAELAASLSRLPSLLRSARVLLSQVSHGQFIDLMVWQDVYRWMLSFGNLFQAIALDMQLATAIESEHQDDEAILEQVI